MISLKNIHKSYQSSIETVRIFDDLDFEIKTGGFVSIMGPSGSGKSTLLFLIAWILRVDSGEITVSDTRITGLSTDGITRFRGHNIAFVFQTFELIPNLTVAENIDIPLDINNTERRFSTEEILERVGLKGKANRYPSELSWGEKQRVAIARAFIANVAYLFADEPTGNLDRKNANQVMDILTELHRETGNTILMITHDSEVAKRADAIYTLQDGKLIQE